MANIVKILRSLITGHVPSTLVDGQIAINQKDKKLFYPDENGVVQEFSLVPGSVSFTEVTADFGSIQDSKSNITVNVANSAILLGSKIICDISGSATADHTTDEIMLFQLSAFATNINPGVGFDIQVFSPHEIFGQIKINYLITN